MTRYFKWDFDNKEQIEYRREGECNGCGACCKTLITFHAYNKEDTEEFDQRDLDDAVYQEGVWSEVNTEDEGGNRRYFTEPKIDLKDTDHKPCSALSPEHKCMVHEMKPKICGVWPTLPEQVTPFEECSYSFVEIGRWPIED